MTAEPIRGIVPSQILYLEHGSARLYAEAIQIVETRQLCWVRPTLLIQNLPNSQEDGRGKSTRKLEQDLDALSLNASHLDERQSAIATAAASPESSNLSFYNLEDCPDLIWPTAFFIIAFDVDFFALLVQLKRRPHPTQGRPQHQLSEFVRSFWTAHKEDFKANLNAAF